MVERLSRGPASVSELARPFSMALPTVVQHLSVLEKAGIVSSYSGPGPDLPAHAGRPGSRIFLHCLLVHSRILLRVGN
jgi:DNA-binding transcriptional ArsR family regulator